MGNKDSRECGGGGGFVGGGCIFLLGLQGFGVRGPTSLWGKKKANHGRSCHGWD